MRFAIDVAFCDVSGLRAADVHAATVAGVAGLCVRTAFVVEAGAGAFERWRLRGRATASSSADDRRPTSGVGLVLVATPIGNLGDLSPRAIETLRDADLIAAEDTRRHACAAHARRHPGGGTAARGARAQRARRRAVDRRRVRDGKRVAYVTDAGMPGSRIRASELVRACLDAGLAVEVVPGPSAVLTALVLSGFPTDRFVFEGFLPRRGTARRERIGALVQASGARPCCSRRRTACARRSSDLLAACGPLREVAVARELTKLFEKSGAASSPTR